jgi:hypothetical protein
MTKENKKINIFTGKHIWKSHLEYHNERTFLHGFPYYQITEVDNVFYLWELDLNDPGPGEYRIRKKNNDFDPLYDEGRELEEALGKKYDSMKLYYTTGKELIEKLKSQE